MPYQTKRRSFNRANSGGSSRRPGQHFGGQRGGGGGGKRGPKKDYIHPSRFVQAARPVEREEYVATHQFIDFAVSDLIKANLTKKGFVTPSPIQDQTIPLVLEGRDVIGIANTGTGKTAAFAIPILHKLVTQPGSRVLMVAPTRELAEQIQEECKQIGRGTGVFGALLIGGSSMGAQLRDLGHNPAVVIGTPGRIKDHIERGTLKLSQFNTVVLDEVDRMLDMGFINDVTEILSRVSEDRQSLFFSATMEPKVKSLIDTFAKEPVTVSVKTGVTSENVEQDIVPYEHMSEKLDRLHDILLKDHVTKVIVFDDTQRSVERLSNELIARGFVADAIHGGKTQGQRQRALARFKRSDATILVATDVAARGIDVQGITHVINFELPDDVEIYTHRSGRTGRAGNHGICVSIVHAKEAYKLKQIERINNSQFHKLDIPSGKDVCRKQFFHFMDKLLSTDISHGDYETYVPMLAEKFADISKEEILKRVAAMEFDRFLKYYENSEDLNIRERDRTIKREPNADRNDRSRSRDADRGDSRKEYKGGGGYSRLFVNLGTKDGFFKASFLQFVLDMSDLKKEVLGKIDMKDMNSWIEIDKSAAPKMIKTMDGKKHNGRMIRMNEADGGFKKPSEEGRKRFSTRERKF